ncbi:MAG: TIGR02391 family protein [Pseudomonadota bacterium]
MKSILNKIMEFQELMKELGALGTTLKLQAPSTILLPSPTRKESKPVSLYMSTISEPEIFDVSRDLFSSGFYNQAVADSFKAVEKYIRSVTGNQVVSATTLMESTFGKTPKLSWSKLETTSEKDEQQGYQRIFSGAMLGVRNPCTHEFDWVDDPYEALELIQFAQHLLRKAKNGINATRPSSAP